MTVAGDRASGPAAPPPAAVPSRLIAFGLSLLGAALAAYLTVEHYTGNRTLACSGHGTIDCAKVTTSAESVVLGVPVAVCGLAFFAGMLALTQPLAWRRPSLHRVRLAAVGAGVAFVLYLVYTEVVTLHAICLWCTGVHVVTLGLLVTLLLTDPEP
jgi:uncharacterized membrane protein